MAGRTPTPLRGASRQQHQTDKPVAVESEMDGTAREVAPREPSLYDDLLPRLSEADRHYLEPLTPFARELQLWVWSEMERARWSHADLARYLGVAQTTVNSWFGSRGVIPEGQGWHKVKVMTGWPEAHLLHLTGYETPPPYRPDVWDFITGMVNEYTPDRATGREGFDDIERAKVREFLTWAKARHVQTRSRPAHRSTTRKAKASKSR